MIDTVVVLAGGLATRMRPLTAAQPKSLLEVAGRPFVEHQIELLARNGIRHIVFCLGYLGEMVEAQVGDGERQGLSIRYVYDGPTLLGTGGAVRKALSLLPERFFLMYGDSYLECDFQAVGRAFDRAGRLGLMTVCRNDNQWDTSNVVFEHGEIAVYDKRRRLPDMRHIDYGLGVLRAAAFTKYSDAVPFDLATVYQDLLGAGQLAAFEIDGRFHEIGSMAGITALDAHLKTKDQPA